MTRIPSQNVRDRGRGSHPHLAYLCLDYGISALGTKGASVHMRSICTALARTGVRLDLHCARVGGDWPAGFADVASCTEHKAPDEFARLQKSLRAMFGPEARIPAEVRQCAINVRAAAELEGAWKHAQRPAAVLERLSLMGVAGLRAARRAGIPHLLEVNALLSEEARTFRALSDYATARAAEDEVLCGTDRVFCVSAPLADAVEARGVPRGRIEVLPNGYDARLFRPRPALALRRRLGLEGRFVVGMVGSLKPWHGVGVLLEAFGKLVARRRDAGLLVVGDGPERDTVDRFRAEHPSLPVVATGAVPHDDIPAMVAACDVATAPYDAHDAFYFSPMKLYEYLAVGVPVVASAQGQITEVIRDGVNGLLVPAGDADALAAALARLARSPVLRQRLARAGRESVRGCTWDANARRILAAVREVGR